MIEFRQVSKSFGKRAVNRDLNIQLADGQIHALIGESGSGKSTLIRLAAGIIAPTKGEVLLNGQVATSIPVEDRAKIYGYMVQGGGLFPHLTCEENIALPARVQGLSGDAFKKSYSYLCDLVSLTAAELKRYPMEISGGQKQRVALVRALILNPPVIFLDEPMGALDPIVRSDLQIELKKIFHDLRKTVVFVTHDLAEAAFLGDRMVLLHDGVVEQQGTLEEFLTNPKTPYVKQFLASQRPPPNLGNWKGFY